MFTLSMPEKEPEMCPKLFFQAFESVRGKPLPKMRGDFGHNFRHDKTHD